MDIRFNKCQRRQIRKLLHCFHGKEHIDLYRVFKAIALEIDFDEALTAEDPAHPTWDNRPSTRKA